MSTVVHFNDLEDLLKEIDPFRAIRISGFRESSYIYSDMPDVARNIVGVLVRHTTSDNEILSWTMILGMYDSAGPDPLSTGEEQAMLESADTIDEVMGLIKERISELGEENMFNPIIRAGIIDIGHALNHSGIWSRLDLERIDVEEEEEPDKNDPDLDYVDDLPF